MLRDQAPRDRGRRVMSLPLEGIRVLDLSRLLPGGFCSLLLADFGADVLKVEDTGMGDYIRWSPPYVEGAEDSAKSALFLALNRNKRSIRLDLKHEQGREALLALVREHDVVLESFRPGVLDRLGVGYERMREVNPGIVYCAISGYGQTGPKREAAGHDMNYLGLIGLLGLTGERGGAARAGRRADSRPRRRLADGRLRDHGRAARARRRPRARRAPGAARLGRGADRRRLDGRRRALLAGDGRRRPLRRRDRAAPRRAAAGRLADLLPALRVRRRLGHARRAGAEVLAGLLSRRRPRGPDRAPVRAARLRGPRARCRRSSAPARAPSGRSSRAATTAAWSRSSTSTRRSTPSSCRPARWSSRSTSPAPRRRCASSASRSSSTRTPGDHRRLPGPGARRAHRGRLCARPATATSGSPSCSSPARPPDRRSLAATATFRA